MKRPDHAELASVLRNNIRPDEMADPETANWLATAQVHATLALVEQQRTANRINLAVAIRKDILLRGTATELSDWLNEGGGVVGYFSAAEQEDLGVA